MRCYLLCVTSGSSVDRQSNNVSLFNLVEQVNVPSDAPKPLRAVIPVEIHAYFQLDPPVSDREIEMRFALRAETGLETFSDTFRRRAPGLRFRVRTVGLPCPPVTGGYTLNVDLRLADANEDWQRQSASWPLLLAELERRPRVTH